MKSLIKHIKDNKSSLISLNEKLIINKDYKSLSDDFCDKFEDDIEYILTNKDATIKKEKHIENIIEDIFNERKQRLAVLNVIKEENLFNSKNKIFITIGFVNVNSFYYKLFLKMSTYCKDHINDRWLCYYNYKNDGHNSTYVLNTYKYYIIIWGDDFQDTNYSSSNIIIQKK